MSRWRWVSAVVLAPVALAGALSMALTSSAPDAVSSPEEDAALARIWVSFRASLPHGITRTILSGQPVTLSLPAADVQPVLNVLVRKFMPASIDVRPEPDKVTLVAALPVERTPLRVLASWRPWINVHMQWAIDPASRKPVLQQLRLGQVPVAPGLVQAVLQGVARHHGMEDALAIAEGTLVSAQVSERHVTGTLQLTDQLKRRALNLVAPPADWPVIVEQHQLMVATTLQQGCHMSHVLARMFDLARRRTLASALMTTDTPSSEPMAARENRVVLLVAGMHAMQWPVQKLLPSNLRWEGGQALPLCLNGREDFAQHYVMSALLSTLAGSRAANAVGVFKEVLDSTPGAQGSGFSFNDIAADLAGSRLGQMARTSPVRLQFQATETRRDSDWMPDVSDLPEFMSAEAFRAQYGGPGNPAFDQVWRDIQQRVDRLPVLR
ncbi:hypothetical protein EYS42_16110 [Aquabacterium lacunae]|uniref:DUF2927 domain-containing protein n=1 Tax=Aquabacterium lacunae TaxID=2528630 RepID=A0A4Q9GVS2_9BURK|nr:hypothetical protein [Aquabacterium lacunae]TBO27952.1 hypothetical protein EYS42_16110 [Aquabacterium lacunae]